MENTSRATITDVPDYVLRLPRFNSNDPWSPTAKPLCYMAELRNYVYSVSRWYRECTGKGLHEAGDLPGHDAFEEMVLTHVKQNLATARHNLRVAMQDPDIDATCQITETCIEVSLLCLADNVLGDEAVLRDLARSQGLTATARVLALDMEERIQDLRARLEEFQESYGRRVYEILEEQENNVRNVGPDTKISDISKPVASTENIAEESCPICLEQFGGEHSGVVFLRCGHPACGDCIGHWVNTTAKKNNTCPLCRVELFKRRPTRVVRGFEARFERELLNIGESYGELQFKRECAQHLEEHIVNLLRELEPDRVGNALARD